MLKACQVQGRQDAGVGDPGQEAHLHEYNKQESQALVQQ